MDPSAGVMPERRIRAAVLADLATLVELSNQEDGVGWSRDNFAAEMALQWSYMPVVVAPVGDAVWGFAVYWHVADEFQLLNIASGLAVRRRGVASSLMGHMIEHAYRVLAKRVLLEVRRTNFAGQALYRKYGFDYSGVRRGYYGGGEDALLMELQL